jgi:hypothetical protein
MSDLFLQMEDIVIPMSRGNMEDIEQDGNPTESSFQASGETMSGDTSTVTNSQVVYEREGRYKMEKNSGENIFTYFLFNSES